RLAHGVRSPFLGLRHLSGQVYAWGIDRRYRVVVAVGGRNGAPGPAFRPPRPEVRRPEGRRQHLSLLTSRPRPRVAVPPTTKGAPCTNRDLDRSAGYPCCVCCSRGDASDAAVAGPVGAPGRSTTTGGRCERPIRARR